MEQEAAPLHLLRLCKNNSKALLTEGKEIRWCKLIIIDHYFPPTEKAFSFFLLLNKRKYTLLLLVGFKSRNWAEQKPAPLLSAKEGGCGTAAQPKGNAFCSKTTLFSQTKPCWDTTPSVRCTGPWHAPVPPPVQPKLHTHADP